ncbi:MAG TPA: hypothetical protein VHZ26_07040 [Caulobacteraceae bacterium]|jgi:hypothetical protein|nr:hypothetical protein [Caulobacteraceae bacterium]
MADAQRRAVENHRRRLRARGLDRFEVRGLEADKGLLRAVAKQLAQGDAASSELRATIEARVKPSKPERGGILQALRRSPLVGADIDFKREAGAGRDIDL